MASYTGSVASGLVWSTLTPVPSIFITGMAFLIYAKPSAGGTLQRAFFLGDEVQIPSNQYNQSTVVFNSTKAGVASSGIFTCFEYNFGFQAAAQSVAGTVDGNWHVFIGNRPPGFGTWTLYRDGIDVTAALPTQANGITLNPGCRLHIHPGSTQGYTQDMALGVVFNSPLDALQIADLSINPWRVIEASPIVLWPYASAGGGGPTYTLSATATAFTATTYPATLRAHRKLAASSQSYAMTGQSAVLRARRKLLTTSAAFSCTPKSANLIRRYRLAASAASCTTTGQSVVLRAHRRILATPAAFHLTTRSANLVYSAAPIVEAEGSLFPWIRRRRR